MPPFPSALPDLCIFDWDSTLVDNYAAIQAAINAARTEFGMAAWNLEETRLNCRRAARETFPEWFGRDWARALEIFYAAFARRHIELLAVMPGAAALLAELDRRKLPMAVNSNKNADYLHREIEFLGWGRYFRMIVGAGDTANGKPAPDGVNMIRAALALGEDAKIWFVGDNELDLRTAQASGCLPIILGAEQSPDNSGGTVYLSGCEELLKHITAITA